MKLLILAGGLGSRISEESDLRPKPMVEIGGIPIITHIMNYYAKFGVKEFVICLGYKGELIKDYFSKLHLRNSDVVFDVGQGSHEILFSRIPDWKVTLVETGVGTGTSGRISMARPYLGSESFFMTYGDGLSDVSLSAELEFHRIHGGHATVLGVKQTPRFGLLEVEKESGKAISFSEKPTDDKYLVNGGFFILNPEVFSYLGDSSEMFEESPLRKLAEDGQLYSFPHDGFWKPMDTLKDKRELEQIWTSGAVPWT
jgi:glucose-1-phosphate cytidylyltransferase